MKVRGNPLEKYLGNGLLKGSIETESPVLVWLDVF